MEKNKFLFSLKWTHRDNENSSGSLYNVIKLARLDEPGSQMHLIALKIHILD